MKSILSLLFALGLLIPTGCGGEAPPPDSTSAQNPGGLTDAQVEDGIGPIEGFEPGPIDPALASQGEQVFTTNCSACHKMGERYVGPALENVTESRSPAYIMNMILNPEEMLQKHPEAKAMLGQYMIAMPNQNLTEDQARAVLEYLRTQSSTE